MHWRMGVDENGLGPQLGPLVVTAVLARLDDTGARRMNERASSLLHDRLADSKQLVDHHDVALGEAWARVVVEAMTGRRAQGRAELLEALSLRARAHLRAPCPQTVASQCWANVAPFAASPEQMARASDDLQSLRARGVQVVWACCEVVCTRRLNDARARGRSRLLVDLGAMEALVIAGRERAGQDVLAVCGKVGGLRTYPPRFGALGGRLHTVLEESAGRSAYRIPGVGEVQFVRDADGADPLVALASLIGKYVREDLMSRIVAHYRSTDASLPDASGYHDPITDRFVAATARTRRERDVPDTCFLRERETRARR